MFTRTPIPHITLGTFGPPPLRLPVRLPVADLTQHLRITGTTNSGKSRFLAHLAVSLITQGEGVTFLDPHGDAVRLVLSELVRRGIYADPAAFDRITFLDLPAGAAVWRYVPFNILDQPFDTPTVARLVLEAFKRAWPALADGGAPAFENAVLAGVSVLRQHRLPVIFLHDVLTDAAWRTNLLRDITDPTVRGFFTRLERWGAREQAQYLESTLRRAFLLSFSPVLRYSLGQTENLLGSFRPRMDAGHSLLVSLALPDPDARRLLGSFLTVFAEQGAMQRSDMPPERRGRGHTLILDEAASLISQSGTALQHILEECRKVGLGLVMANQSEGQIPERLATALANAGTEAVFRLGRADAERAARRIGMIEAERVKHAGDARAVHPLYAPLPEQWEEWASAITSLRPRQLFVHRPPAKQTLLRHLHPHVVKLRTPDLPDPDVAREELDRVTRRYLRDCFTERPLIEEELTHLRPQITSSGTKRRMRLPMPGGTGNHLSMVREDARR